MSGYVEAGYVVVLGSLSAYGASLIARERRVRGRRTRVEQPVRVAEGSIDREQPESPSQ